jgi:hypothetical protein
LRAGQIEYQRESIALKKGTQEENLNRQHEWAKRFSIGVAEQLTEKKMRVDSILSEKKRIKQACESYRKQQKGFYTTQQYS